MAFVKRLIFGEVKHLVSIGQAFFLLKYGARGQTIGVAAPASPPNDPEVVRFGIEIVESLGFKVKPAPHLVARFGYLAGEDATRAQDLNDLFAD
jgi:muramoyltetrapeptide carboxypeptidase